MRFLKEKITKEEAKRLWKFFLIGFIIAFLFFNWPEILVFSNYRVLWHEIKSALNLPEVRPLAFPEVEPLKNQPAENQTENPQTLTSANEEKIYEVSPHKVEIAKLGVTAPIVFTEVNDYTAAKEALKQGVLLYRGGAMPGENGKAIILGHSAPIGWPDIDYDNVFSEISQLGPGDEITVYFNQKKYVYQVFASKIFFPKEEDTALYIENENQAAYLLLITCWPRGKDYQRLAVFSRLIDKN